MKIVFISGPDKADEVTHHDENLRRATEIIARLYSHGHVAVCPHADNRNFEPFINLEDEVFISRYLRILEQCNAVAVLPGWNESERCRAEVKHALRHEIPVYHMNTQPGCTHLLAELEKDIPEGTNSTSTT